MPFLKYKMEGRIHETGFTIESRDIKFGFVCFSLCFVCFCFSGAHLAVHWDQLMVTEPRLLFIQSSWTPKYSPGGSEYHWGEHCQLALGQTLAAGGFNKQIKL